MIKRELSKKIKGYLKSFPIVTITGPRQSGKTTLLKHLFPKRTYVSLEDPDKRAFAEEDPKRFLATFPAPVIFDEIQKVPRLFSYLQTLTDEIGKNGMYVLSGSQNFLLMEKISQSLGGRFGILSLIPFGVEELKNSKIVFGNNLDSVLFTGFYPRIWDKKLNAFDWYINYVQTYLERDVRQIKNVNNLRLFQRFLRLCAGRTGQILSLSSFANDCGISHNTANSWLSILEASYIIYLLPPYRKNFNKRLIKSPKLYFYDTGLACSLLGIENKRQLITHPLRGSLFETFVISELVKNRFNRGKIMNLSYFRDKSGHEIDCLIEEGGKIKAVEIKSGQTISSNFFKNLSYWQNLSKTDPKNSFVVYGGNEGQKRSLGTVVGWEKLGGLF